MSRTLFLYILKDLVKMFFMASGVLAGIMSFGGLLRPLTEHGLSVGQVRDMLLYFQFPMTAYSLPIAALFATTMVYGRLSADNEIVACRAAGISHLALTVPAMVLGLAVAIIGLLLLCFIVPIFMLKAEKVVFSNVGQIVASQIERSHQLKLEQAGESVTVFAQGAQVLPPDPKHPKEQCVLLLAPMFVTYEPSPDKSPDAVRVPRDFFLARQATIYIYQNEETDELYFTAQLQEGCKFPRKQTQTEGVVESASFSARGQSLVRENTKFMKLDQLQALQKDVSNSRRVRKVLDTFILNEQIDTFLRTISSQLTGEQSEAWLVNDADAIVIQRGGANVIVQDRKLIIGAPTADLVKPVRVIQKKDDKTLRSFEAQMIEITAIPDMDAATMHMVIEFNDAVEKIGDTPTQRSRVTRVFDMPMSKTIMELPKIRSARYYIDNAAQNSAAAKALKRESKFITNTVGSELHARLSFALSCLILVMVGCALGMMFRSGNFLSAFALSVFPALVCIALIITGQHTCENIPRDLTGFNDPYDLGRNLIWSGNVAVAVIAVVLLGRLQRQ